MQVYVIERSASDDAIQTLDGQGLDCFAPLAMTPRRITGSSPVMTESGMLGCLKTERAAEAAKLGAPGQKLVLGFIGTMR
jgi:hypothetical protein